MAHVLVDKYGNTKNYGINKYVFENASIYLDGLLYTYGKKAGIETVNWLYDEFCKTGKVPYELLRGAYSIILEQEEKITVFTDNSNLHCVYYSKDYVCNRFLELVSTVASCKELKLDDVALCEYYTLGNVFFDKTFFSDIHILNSRQVLVINNGLIKVEQKGIDDIEGRTSLSSINEYFDKFAYSISELRVCQALTGGYDSRLIYACLSKHLDDHVAISGNDPNHTDIKCAHEVAKINGDELEIIGIEKPSFTEELLDDVFNSLDGIQSVDFDADIRLLSFKKALSNRFDLHLTGDGGVLHKDWEWTQDLPFYNKKKSNAKKFYHQRLYYIKNDSHLGKRLLEPFKEQQSRFVDELNKISKSVNTQSYDSWYYYVSGNRRVNYNNNPVPGIISYAPLEEIDVVRYSYALPRFERFFYNSMRKTISNENMRVARVKTNYGTNASTETKYLIHDCFSQLAEYTRKASRLISRKIFGKTAFNNSVLDWDLEMEIRKSTTLRNAIRFVKENEYIKNSIKEEQLSYTEIQRIMHIHWIYSYAANSSIR